MSPDIIVSRKDVKEALVRTAVKDEEFRKSLLENPKRAVEHALGTALPDNMKVILLRETEDEMYVVLPKEFPSEVADLSDAELERVAGGFLDAESRSLLHSTEGMW